MPAPYPRAVPHVPEARKQPPTYAELSGHEANTQTGSQLRGRHNPKAGLTAVMPT
jgi:hypothetical protein